MGRPGGLGSTVIVKAVWVGSGRGGGTKADTDAGKKGGDCWDGGMSMRMSFLRLIPVVKMKGFTQ